MNRRFRKACALVLTISMVLPLSCCKKEETAGKRTTVREDDPWFEISTFDVDSGADPDRPIEHISYKLAGSDEDHYVIHTFGAYKLPPVEEIDYQTFNSNDYNFDYVTVVDRNTKKTVNTFDLQKGLDKELITYEFIISVIYLDGKVTVKTGSKERDYDPLTGELLDTRKSDSNGLGDNIEYYKVGDYVIESIMLWDDYTQFGSCKFNVESPDGNKTSFELSEPGIDFYSEGVLALSDTSAVIPVSTNKGQRFYELDLAAGKLTSAKAKKYEWLDMTSLGFPTTGTDGSVYFSSGKGVYAVDARKKTIEEVFNTGWCGINQGLIFGITIDLVEFSGDSLTVIGQTKPVSMYESYPSVFQIMEFKRADKNPNAGKTILELYAYESGIDEGIGEAVAEFNENNDKYFIEVSERYDLSEYIDVEGHIFNADEDEFELFNIEADSRISNALAIDIMNGTGPDILINTSNFSRFYDPDCLADLSPYVDGLDSGNYFTNIIDGAKTGDKLYQLPVSFAIYGISTEAKEAGQSGVGFTLDEYQSFVSNSLNGKDIMMVGQAVYFSMLFNSMSGKFIVDGKADFSGPEFKLLADYVKDNVPEKSLSWDDVPDDIKNYVSLHSVRGIGGFFQSSIVLNDPTILGTPSIDGRGPMFTTNCSVAISAQAANVDACGEFVKILLSDKMQSYLAMNDQFVLNRNAFRSGAEAGIQYYNNGGANNSNGISYMSRPDNKYSDKDIDKVEKIIFSCSITKTEDSPISIILIEEMPAYFLGQKKLDAVIKIAQNRVQKVLDERGSK